VPLLSGKKGDSRTTRMSGAVEKESGIVIKESRRGEGEKNILDRKERGGPEALPWGH